jgi:hypothetical protein
VDYRLTVRCLTMRWELVPWRTSTAVTGSAEVFPGLVLLARTLSLGLRLAISTAAPLARRTLVLGVKLIPTRVVAASAGLRSSAADQFATEQIHNRLSS